MDVYYKTIDVWSTVLSLNEEVKSNNKPSRVFMWVHQMVVVPVLLNNDHYFVVSMDIKNKCKPVLDSRPDNGDMDIYKPTIAKLVEYTAMRLRHNHLIKRSNDLKGAKGKAKLISLSCMADNSDEQSSRVYAMRHMEKYMGMYKEN